MAAHPLSIAPSASTERGVARDAVAAQIAAGQLQEALTGIKDLLRQDALDAEAWLLMGSIAKQAHQPLQAARAFRKALVLAPRRRPAIVELLSQTEAAVPAGSALWLVPAILGPRTPEALLKSAIAESLTRGRGRLAARATAHLARRSTSAASGATAWVDAARIAFAYGEHDFARRASRRAAILKPESQRTLLASLETGAFSTTGPAAWRRLPSLRLTIDTESPVLGPMFDETGFRGARFRIADRNAGTVRSGRFPRSDSVAVAATARALARALSETARNSADRIGWDWREAQALQSDTLEIPLSPQRLDAFAAAIVEAYPALTSEKLLPCPNCGESRQLRRDRHMPITAHANALMDCARFVPVAREIAGDPALDRNWVDALVSKALSLKGLGQYTVECGACGIAYFNWKPDPTTVEHFYERKALNEGVLAPDRYFGRATLSWWVRPKANPVSWLSAAAGSLEGKRVLDVGCGDGSMMWMAQRLGARVWGLEPSPRSIAHAREILGLDGAGTGYYGPDSFEPESMDTIFSSHALEHFSDIAPFRDGVVRHLRPGGLLMLGVPRADSSGSDKIKGVGNSHLFGFRRRFLESWLSDAGLEIIDVKSDVTPPPEADIDPELNRPLWSGMWNDTTVLARKPG